MSSPTSFIFLVPVRHISQRSHKRGTSRAFFISLPLNVARQSDTSCQLLTPNFEIWSFTKDRLSDCSIVAPLSNLHRQCWGFKKAVLRCLHLMRNNTLPLWWMHFMGRAALEADAWLLWSAAPKENMASSFCSNDNSFFVSIFSFCWSHFVSTSYVFRGSRCMGAPLCHQGDYWVSVCVHLDVAVL